MKKSFVLVALLVFSQAAAYSAPNAKEEQEIRKLDDQRLAAILKEDIPMLQKLMTDDFVYTHSSGNVQTKAQFLGDMKAGTWAYKSLKLQNVKVRVFGDTAILNGGCNMTGVMRGKDVRLAMYFTEVYTRTSGQWHWLLWQSTRLPPEDPNWKQVATQQPYTNRKWRAGDTPITGALPGEIDVGRKGNRSGSLFGNQQGEKDPE